MPRALALSLVQLALLAVLTACGQAAAPGGRNVSAPPEAAAAPAPPDQATATFAMGCFWCAEDAFEKHAGVLAVVSGYTGGTRENPSYSEVSSGGTGHYESIEVTYDPAKVSYDQLLEVFWHNVDPFDPSGQFCDTGEQYRAAIFTHDEAQRQAAEASRTRVGEQLGKAVQTQVLPAVTFYPAEDDHQDYAERNPLRYHFYRSGCGRDARLQRVWGKAAGGQH